TRRVITVVDAVSISADATTSEIYSLTLHDALPISPRSAIPSASTPSERMILNTGGSPNDGSVAPGSSVCAASPPELRPRNVNRRSEEHTSELQSRENLVCRLLLEKKITVVIDRTGS